MKSIVNDDIDDLKEIDKRLKKYRHGYRMYIRYSVVKMVLEGNTRGEAAKKFNVHYKSAENWVKLYYKNGLDGLEPDYSNCGLDCKLSDDQLVELKNIIINSGKVYNINSVRNLIKDKYNIQYTYKQTWVIVRKKLGLKIDNHKLIV